MKRIHDHPGWCLAAILAAALAVRLAAGMWWQQRLPAGARFVFGDSESYWQLGQTIARGRPFEYGPDRLQVFRTPGYPAILAPLFWLRDEPPVLWGRALSAVLGTAAVGLVAGLAWLLFDHTTALLAAAIAAVYPESIALGVFVLSEAPFAPWMLLNLICWAQAWRRESGPAAVGWALAAGASAGLATLMRPSWLLFVPFATVVGLFVGLLQQRNWKRELVLSGVVLCGLTLTMAPWWLRNYRVVGRFVPTTLQIGASLYDGISPEATGASDMRFVGAFVAQQRAADAEADADLAGLFEDRLDRRMRSAAIAWAKVHPLRVLQLAGIKLARMWSPLPNASEFQSRLLRLVLAASYTPLIVLSLIGVWRYAGRGWPSWLCFLPAIYLTCLHVVFVSSIRYRQPAMLPLIVLAAGALMPIGSRHPRNPGQAASPDAQPPSPAL